MPLGFLCISILLVVAAWCQQPPRAVQQKSYDIMLRTLLKHNVPELTVAQATARIKEFQIVDARSPKEYAVSHIKDAHFYNYDSPEESESLLTELDKTKPILVYCSVGYRSEKVAKRFMDAGFTNVYNLYGGLFEWSNQQQALYHESQPTTRIHGYNKLWSRWIVRGVKVLD